MKRPSPSLKPGELLVWDVARGLRKNAVLDTGPSTPESAARLYALDAFHRTRGEAEEFTIAVRDHIGRETRWAVTVELRPEATAQAAAPAEAEGG